MDVVKFVMLTGCFLVGQLKGETVNLFTMCGNGRNDPKLVRATEVLTVEIIGKDWPTGQKSCEVEFQSKNGVRGLYYTFQRFRVDDFVTDVKLFSRPPPFFIDLTFNKFVPPDVGVRKPATSTLQLSVTRTNLAATTLNASVNLSTKNRSVPGIVTKTYALPVWVITGIAIGVIFLVLL